MRAVLDTNIIVSALIVPRSLPARILDAWRHDRFELLTSETFIEELRSTSRYPKIRSRIVPSAVGGLINEIAKLGTYLANLPTVDRSPDARDNYLLGMAQAGSADFLVTGDKADLLSLVSHGPTRIVTARAYADLLKL